MRAVGTFSSQELRAIKRTFNTRKATPEEVCLLLRPCKRSGHMVVAPCLLLPVFGLLLWYAGGRISDTTSGLPIQLEMVAKLTVAKYVVALFLLLLTILPSIYSPRFELTIRPGADSVVMRGFGFEQYRPTLYCELMNRHFWCSFSVDRVRYLLSRHWWQLPFPVLSATTVLDRVLVPSKAELNAQIAGGEVEAMKLESVRRLAWATAFGEALVTENEVVLLAPPPAELVWSWLGVLGGSGAVFAWHAFHDSVHAVRDVGYRTVDHVSCAFPLWLPSVVLIIVVGFFGIKYDPWFRRAIAIVPKGLRLIRIQVGKHVLGESPFADRSISFEDHDDDGHLVLRTPFWDGAKSVWRPLDCWQAPGELKKWAGVQLETEENASG